MAMHMCAGDAQITVPRTGTCAAIQAIGRANFASQLLRASRSFACVDFVSIFLFPTRHAPMFFGTDGIPGRAYAESAARHYVKRHYQDDPNLDAMFSSSVDDTLITYLNRETIPTMNYWLNCYDRAHILDRVSLLSRTANGLPFSVSFYGGVVSGSLGDAGRRALDAFLPMARALALRHIEIAQPAVSNWDDTLTYVRLRFPSLSTRESEAITGALLNMTASQTAARLGIGTTSVITHRKRAYDRLGVKDMRQLFSILRAAASIEYNAGNA
jgi:DNA-binding CsgD family transcriptional regulator